MIDRFDGDAPKRPEYEVGTGAHPGFSQGGGGEISMYSGQ